MRKLTLTPGEVRRADVDAVRSAGVSDDVIRDAIVVCATFSIIDRIADALGFRVPTQEEFDRIAPVLYDAGYAFLG